jgi:hypothetical protein
MNDISNSRQQTCLEMSKDIQETSRILLVQLEETEEKIEALQLFRSELLTQLARQKQQIGVETHIET